MDINYLNDFCLNKFDVLSKISRNNKQEVLCMSCTRTQKHMTSQPGDENIRINRKTESVFVPQCHCCLDVVHVEQQKRVRTFCSFSVSSQPRLHQSGRLSPRCACVQVHSCNTKCHTFHRKIYIHISVLHCEVLILLQSRSSWPGEELAEKWALIS